MAHQMDCGVSKQVEPEEPKIKTDLVGDEKFLQHFLEASHRAETSQYVSSDVVFVAICTKVSLKKLKASKAKFSLERPETPVVECGLVLLDSRNLHLGIPQTGITNLISTRYFSVYTEVGRSSKPAPCEFAETEFIPDSAFRSTLHGCLRIPDSRASDPKALRKIVIVNTSLNNSAFMHLGGEHLFDISRTIDITALAKNTLQVEPKKTFAHLLTELKVNHKEEELVNCGNLATFMMHALVILAIRSASRNKSLSEDAKVKLEKLRTFAQRSIMARVAGNSNSSILFGESGSDDPLSTEPELFNPGEIKSEDDSSGFSESNIDYRERPKPIPNVCAGEKNLPVLEWRRSVSRSIAFRPSAKARHSPGSSRTSMPNNVTIPHIVPPPLSNDTETSVASAVKPMPQNALEKVRLSIELSATPVTVIEGTTPVAPTSAKDTLSQAGCCTPTDFTAAIAEPSLPAQKTKNSTNTNYWNGFQKLDESEDEEDGGVLI